MARILNSMITQHTFWAAIATLYYQGTKVGNIYFVRVMNDRLALGSNETTYWTPSVVSPEYSRGTAMGDNQLS